MHREPAILAKSWSGAKESLRTDVACAACGGASTEPQDRSRLALILGPVVRKQLDRPVVIGIIESSWRVAASVGGRPRSDRVPEAAVEVEGNRIVQAAVRVKRKSVHHALNHPGRPGIEEVFPIRNGDGVPAADRWRKRQWDQRADRVSEQDDGRDQGGDR